MTSVSRSTRLPLTLLSLSPKVHQYLREMRDRVLSGPSWFIPRDDRQSVLTFLIRQRAPYCRRNPRHARHAPSGGVCSTSQGRTQHGLPIRYDGSRRRTTLAQCRTLQAPEVAPERTKTGREQVADIHARGRVLEQVSRCSVSGAPSPLTVPMNPSRYS